MEMGWLPFGIMVAPSSVEVRQVIQEIKWVQLKWTYRKNGYITGIFLSFKERKQTKSGERKLKCV
jgi:hypothetical protein